MTKTGDDMALHETLRTILLETADAYRALTEMDHGAALDHLKNIEQYVKLHAERSNQLSERERAKHDKVALYASICPAGYDTIIAWSLKTGRYTPEGDVDDYVRDSLYDSRQLREYLKRLPADSTRLHKVPAPPVLSELGIEAINAYHISILEAVLGD